MGYKDITTKKLESYPDVFADIFNVLVLNDLGIPIKNEEKTLKDEATEGFYRDYNGKLRNVFQDILKSYTIDNHVSYLACFNIENQTSIDRSMAVRILGYKFTVYKKQLETYNYRLEALKLLRNNAETEDMKQNYQKEIDKIGNFELVPFIPIVLNFSDKEWDEPLSLRDLSCDSPYKDLEDDFKIMVFNVKSFSDELIEKFTSDFKVFLKMINGEDEENLYRYNIKHVTELIDMIIAFTGSEKLINAREEITIKDMKGVVKTMGDVFTIVAERGREEATIKDAKKLHDLDIDENIIIEMIMEGLDLSESDARDFFNEKVLG